MNEELNRSKPHGHLLQATLLCGCCGGLLAVVLSLLDIFASGQESLMLWLEEAGFRAIKPGLVREQIEWFISFGLALITAFILLDSALLWRRIFVLLAMLVLLLGSVFSLALWGVYFPPFVTICAILSAGLFSIFYASQHQMACDSAELKKTSEKEAETDSLSEILVTNQPEEPETNQEPEQAKEKKNEKLPFPKFGRAQRENTKVRIPSREVSDG